MRKIGTGTILAAAALLTAPAGAMAHGGHDAPALCGPYLGLLAAFNSDAPDPAAIETLLADAEAAVPEEYAEPLGTMVAAGRAVLESRGEDFSAFETPEFGAAQSTMDGWAFESCPFDVKYEVAASDFAFGGLPEQIPAGNVAILVENIGAEVHEMAVIRKNDGVTETWDELIALPQEEVETKAEYIGGVFVPLPEAQALFTAELVPGEYILICFVSEGSTATADGEMTEGTGAPHFAHGMIQPFTVTG